MHCSMHQPCHLTPPNPSPMNTVIYVPRHAPIPCDPSCFNPMNTAACIQPLELCILLCLQSSEQCNMHPTTPPIPWTLTCTHINMPPIPYKPPCLQSPEHCNMHPTPWQCIPPHLKSPSTCHTIPPCPLCPDPWTPHYASNPLNMYPTMPPIPWTLQHALAMPSIPWWTLQHTWHHGFNPPEHCKMHPTIPLILAKPSCHQPPEDNHNAPIPWSR